MTEAGPLVVEGAHARRRSELLGDRRRHRVLAVRLGQEVGVLMTARRLGGPQHEPAHEEPGWYPHPEGPPPPADRDGDAPADEAQEGTSQRARLVVAHHAAPVLHTVVVGDEGGRRRARRLQTADAEAGEEHHQVRGGGAVEGHACRPQRGGTGEQSRPAEPVGQDAHGEGADHADARHGERDEPHSDVGDAEGVLDPGDGLRQRGHLPVLDGEGRGQGEDREPPVAPGDGDCRRCLDAGLDEPGRAPYAAGPSHGLTIVNT